MTPLGQLIEKRKQEHDPPLTNTDIARLMGMSRQRVQQLINDPIEDFLPTATLRSLARAIDLPLPEVVAVMLETARLPAPAIEPSENPVETEIMNDPELSDGAKMTLLRVRREEEKRVRRLMDQMLELVRKGADEHEKETETSRQPVTRLGAERLRRESGSR